MFIGDLAYSDVHPYLLEPDAPAWLAQLDRARSLFPGGVTLLPGHGLPGGLEPLLDREQVYLETYLGAVAELQRDGRLDQAAITELERRMDRLLPGGALRMLVAPAPNPSPQRSSRESPADPPKGRPLDVAVVASQGRSRHQAPRRPGD